MEASVERTDSQKSQNNGPRVSFNRDVHVKRIGSRPNEHTNHPTHQIHANHTQSPQLRRELPSDLTEEGILKEAALVLSQAERVKCTAEGGSDIIGGRVNVKSRGRIERKNDDTSQFHSLPTRKKAAKPVSRSVSDASAKKSKRPSIFNIFSKKGDQSSDQIDSKENQVKKITRSKSDVGESKEAIRKAIRKRNNSESDDVVISKKKPLSPIIENPPRESYFSSPAKPGRANRNGSTVNLPPGNIGYTSQEDLDLVPSKPIADSIKDTITSIVNHSKSSEDMHSSQQPIQKPPLTKGVTVDGIVKRLSMERYSPLPHLHGPAFSYTRPNDQIIYAQVVCDTDGRSKQTIHSSYNSKERELFASQSPGDTVDSVGLKKPESSSHSNILFKNIEKHERSISPVRHLDIGRKVNGDYFDKKLNGTGKTNSDEDEGLGFETRRDYDEPPIVPVIRDVVSPVRIQLDASYRGRADGTEERRNEHFPEMSDLSNRRKMLESRIFNRQRSTELLDTKIRSDSHEKEMNGHSNEYYQRRAQSHPREYRSPEREYPQYHRYNEPNKYSPERSHVSPSREASNSKIVRETRYYHDGHDGYRDQYRKETTVGVDGIPHTREYHTRRKLNSPREIDLVNRSSPEQNYRQTQQSANRSDKFQSLKREKKQQRSFDKGDSGIENDYRKDSFNDGVSPRWKRRTTRDDIKASDLFIKREKQHSEQLQAKRFGFVFRERSIDDGSHFDPRLDKYPSGTLKSNRTEKSINKSGTLKSEKKIGGLEKVKQLFTGSSKKKLENKQEKDKFMVREDEMRQRYKEYRPNKSVNSTTVRTFESREPKLSDIATRRRLSTPKASPIPKRTPSQKSSKSSSTSLLTETPQKLGWFKSLDRLSRKKSLNSNKVDTTTTEEEFSNLRSNGRPSNIRKSTSPHRNGQKLRFFGDTDLESNASVSKAATFKSKPRKTVIDSSTLAKSQKYSQSAFDLNTMPRKPKYGMSSEKHRSSSLQNLDDDHQNGGRRTTTKHTSRSSRYLHDISESASDNETDRPKHISIQNSSGAPKPRQRVSSSAERNASTPLMNGSRQSSFDEADNVKFRGPTFGTLERGRERERVSPYKDEFDQGYRKPPTGPQKPARSLDRRKTFSRERDRVQDSSGTEGDSSQQSQRSVVYLHATTIGAIPQPHVLNSRRALSREELTSLKSSQNREPMTRTVSRSVSVLAPWKPKHLRDGYEINYSQNPDKQKDRRKDRTSSLTRPRKSTAKDDLSSVRNSSLTSNSTATLPNRSKDRDSRSNTLSRPRKKENFHRMETNTPPAISATGRRRWNE
ncbi:hypothetical protein HA402_004900 [Bradysia odoriphaga]|nr:hypothetical protein HA402_004900 [Bradysia odoriphaga]